VCVYVCVCACVRVDYVVDNLRFDHVVDNLSIIFLCISNDDTDDILRAL